MAVNITGLGEYTDEDLIAELMARGWEILAKKQKIESNEMTVNSSMSDEYEVA